MQIPMQHKGSVQADEAGTEEVNWPAVSASRVLDAHNSSHRSQSLYQCARPRTAPECSWNQQEGPSRIRMHAFSPARLDSAVTNKSKAVASAAGHISDQPASLLPKLHSLPGLPAAPLSSPSPTSSNHKPTTTSHLQYGTIPTSTTLLPIAQLNTGLPPRPCSSPSIACTYTPSTPPPSFLFTPSSTIQPPAPSFTPGTPQPRSPPPHAKPMCLGDESCDLWTPPSSQKRYADKRRSRARTREQMAESAAQLTDAAGSTSDATAHTGSPAFLGSSALTRTECLPGGGLSAAASSALSALEPIGRARRRKEPRHAGHRYTGVSYKKKCVRRMLYGQLPAYPSRAPWRFPTVCKPTCGHA